MPSLTLYTDLSPNFPFAFSAIEQQRVGLAQEGCFVPVAPPWSFGQIKTHQLLWEAVVEQQPQGGKTFTPFWQGWFTETLMAARRGENILLYGREPSLIRQKNLLQLFRERQEFAAYDILVVAVLGRPACFFEQFSRLMQQYTWPHSSPLSHWHIWIRETLPMLDLIPLWQEELGKEHVTIFVDSSASAQALGASKGHLAALRYLGLGPDFCQPAHILRLASREARHLLFLSQVAYNAWPRLDEGQLINTLQTLEQAEGWDMRPSAPPQVLAAFNKQAACKIPSWETSLHLEEGSLACPELVSPDIPWELYSGISDAAISAFLAALPHDLCDTLCNRYERDRRLLCMGHERIYADMERRRSVEMHVSAEEPQPVVSVLTLAHNQADYIGQCIESVLAQQTTFPVQHIILDHCSTDGTADVIARYAAQHPSIRPVLLSRWLPEENVRGLFLRCTTEFAALCDGDDYFTDPHKLQRQVDFLRQYPDCALCFHPVDVIYEDGSPARVYPPENLLPGGVRRFYTLKDLLQGNPIQTNSVMYRWRFREGLPDWFNASLVPGDWYWHLLHAEMGLVGYLQERMCVYRRHSASLYATAEGDHVNHRTVHGLAELRVYKECNQHFNGRYYQNFCQLAVGVFADFVQNYAVTGDDSFLQKGVALCPEFARDFLAQVKVL